MPASEAYPSLRPVEVLPAEYDGQSVLVVHDPAGQASGTLAVSSATLFILSLLDGENGPEQIQEAFGKQFGQALPLAQLDGLVAQLDQALYLDSERFVEHLAAQKAAYQAAPTRLSGNEELLGAEEDGLAATLTRLLANNERILPQAHKGRLIGLVAPHLDFDRGQACYADVYGLLAERKQARRFVILGTNHFGQATSVVVTRKDFETPLGITRTDGDFIDTLGSRCGIDLCAFEADHQREHSVELQVLMLQHVLGTANFEIVPVLCCDPSHKASQASHNGGNFNLQVFGERLGELIREDDDETIVIAGADLSHVGPRFGDDCDLEDAFLDEVGRKDRSTIDAILGGDPARFLKALASHENSTRVCSVGCLYGLMTALSGAEAELLRYHQAVDESGGTGVTCASMAFWDT